MNKHTARKRRGAKTKVKIRNSECIRIVVFRSNKNIYAKIVERDLNGDKVLVCASTKDKAISTNLTGKKCEQAFEVGKLLAKKAKDIKLTGSLGFDRCGYKYHGRVEALARGAREGGLKF